MFDTSKLSIVISGPVLGTNEDEKYFTRETCKNARFFFPKAEVVLSTWKDEDVEGLDYDVLVLSEDPGPNKGENTNRQICSRLAGIKKASKEYVLAIRSESIINSINFTKYIDVYNCYRGKYRFLENRVIIPASYPACRGELFHLGDWYFFGHKEDVLAIWNIPYMDDKLFNQKDDDLLYNPHRYLITAFIKKYYPLSFIKKEDVNEENRKIYEAVLAENFVITGFYEYGISSLKYPLSGSFFNRLFHCEVGYTFNEWKELYNKYSGGKEKIKKTFAEKFMINVCVPIKRSKIGGVFMSLRAKVFKLNYWE